MRTIIMIERSIEKKENEESDKLIMICDNLIAKNNRA